MVVGIGAWALSLSYVTQKWAFPERILAYGCTYSFIHDLVQTKHCDWLRYVLKSCTITTSAHINTSPHSNYTTYSLVSVFTTKNMAY